MLKRYLIKYMILLSFFNNVRKKSMFSLSLSLTKKNTSIYLIHIINASFLSLAISDII